jgi:hypothetical protein
MGRRKSTPPPISLSDRAYIALIGKQSRIDAVHAVAPIIVAEYLRAMAEKYDVVELHEEANKLDPEGTPRAIIVPIRPYGMMHAILPGDWFCPVCMIRVTSPGVHDWEKHRDQFPPTIQFGHFKGARSRG